MTAEKKERLAELASYDGRDRIVHFTDFLLAKAGENRGTQRFDCEFPALNEQIQGLETGEIAVVTGYAKNGKTLFAESWLRSMCKITPALNPVIFSFEVQADKIMAKYTPEPERPIYLPMELRTMDFEWLLERCLEAKLKYASKAILIDHLHFLVDMNTRQNMSLNIGAFMRRLKHDVALKLNLAVILIAHQGQPKEDKEASFGGMRDSSFIGQESDMTLIVSRRRNFEEAEIEAYVTEARRKLVKRVNGGELIPDDAEAEIDRNAAMFTAALRDHDRHSCRLATVRVAVARRSGAYDWAKLFRKSGHFLEEL
ncbi:MAG TPA: DnaB-like helicase C-terminal domain-containing protein [Sphingomicrobium sp.]|nr:DnaB-like helicase C-terminal domain-containing protein [Sphingomicrobium sp.]